MRNWAKQGTLNATCDVYAVQVGGGFVYAGCSDFKIRVWNLATLQKSHMLIGCVSRCAAPRPTVHTPSTRDPPRCHAAGVLRCAAPHHAHSEHP
jgi:hypothetical protein